MNTVLKVENVQKRFHVGPLGARKTINAVNGVNLELKRGQTTALVGESGSGKSTLARCIVGLTAPSSGRVVVDGVGGGSTELGKRGSLYRTVQMVFQDPHASLNPRRTVLSTIEEPMYRLLQMKSSERLQRTRELLELVQLDPEFLTRYPHELSGGQRQRVGIARALAPDPQILVLDEPTSSLDVSVRGHVIALLQDIQERLGLAYLFISHDLAVVRTISTNVHVMYHGDIVEYGETSALFEAPQHPYTRRLLSSIPVPEWGGGRRARQKLPRSKSLPG